MSNALDHVRYECGIAGEEVARLVDALERQLAECEREKFGLETKLQVKGYQRQLDDLRETLRDVLQTIAEAESMEDLRYCQEYCNQLPITSKLGAGKTEES